MGIETAAHLNIGIRADKADGIVIPIDKGDLTNINDFKKVDCDGKITGICPISSKVNTQISVRTTVDTSRINSFQTVFIPDTVKVNCTTVETGTTKLIYTTADHQFRITAIDNPFMSKSTPGSIVCIDFKHQIIDGQNGFFIQDNIAIDFSPIQLAVSTVQNRFFTGLWILSKWCVILTIQRNA